MVGGSVWQHVTQSIIQRSISQPSIKVKLTNNVNPELLNSLGFKFGWISEAALHCWLSSW